MPPLDVLALGADADRAPRVTGRVEAVRSKSLISVGILEPRKNQVLLLDVAETLWREGLDFELNLVGRVNPHFGRPLEKRVKAMAKKFPGLRHHAAAAGLMAALNTVCLPLVRRNSMASRDAAMKPPVLASDFDRLPQITSTLSLRPK